MQPLMTGIYLSRKGSKKLMGKEVDSFGLLIPVDFSFFPLLDLRGGVRSR
jgi:hypothetical protein